MNRIQRSLATALLPLSALLAAPAVQAQAVDDWQHTVPACAPDSLNSLRFAQINAAAGYIRANNPDAGVLHFTCNVLDSFASSIPLWNRLVLQFRDVAGGRIMATLYEKNKVTGASVAVANVVSTPSAAITNVAVAAPMMNFAINTYYIVVSIQSAAQNPPQAHTVMLAV